MEDNINLIETGLIIDENINIHLKETAAWCKFLGIIGFIYSGLLIIISVFAVLMFTRLPGEYSGTNTGSIIGGTVGVIYLLIAGVVFFMSVHLYRFAKNTHAALQVNDQVILAQSFRHLKIYFRFAGIVTLIALIFSILGVLGMMMSTAFGRG